MSGGNKKAASRITVLAVAAAAGLVVWLLFDNDALKPELIWLWVAAVIVAVIVSAGYAYNGDWFGALLDPKRNRVSLSRTQIAAWSVLVLSALATISLARVLPGAPLETVQACEERLIKVDEEADVTVCADAAPLDIEIPGELLVLMGLAAGSFASALVLNPPVDDNRVRRADGPALSNLVTGIRSESKTTDPGVDMSRVQMLVITVVLVLVYGITLGDYIDGAALFERTAARFPPLSGTVVSLLAISHTGYLAVKATDE